MSSSKYMSVFQRGDTCMSDSHGNLSESQTPSLSSESGPGGSSEVNLEMRHRGGCLTVWLVVMSLFYGLLVVGIAIGIYLSYSSDFAPPPTTDVLNILTLIFVVLGSAGVVGMWLWKKWGYYLLMGG